MPLIRHTIECILAFLMPPELCSAMRVAKIWKSAMDHAGCFGFVAVRNMNQHFRLRSGDVDQYPDAIFVGSYQTTEVLNRSAFARHVMGLGTRSDPQTIVGDKIGIDTARFLYVTHMSCQVMDPHAISRLYGLVSRSPSTATPRVVQFPSRLMHLEIRMDRIITLTPRDILHAVSTLSFLQSFILIRRESIEDWDFAPLHNLSNLTEFSLLKSNWSDPKLVLSDAQVEQLQTLPYITKMGLSAVHRSSFLKMLTCTHPLQWQDLDMMDEIDQECAEALCHAAQLTQLRAQFFRTTDFLTHLPRLRVLELHSRTNTFHPKTWIPSAEAIGRALCTCHHIQNLTLRSPQHTMQLTPMFAAMPQLTRLRFIYMDNMEDLECLVSTPSLTSLDLTGCTFITKDKLTPLFTCHNLTTLRMSYTARMNGEEQELFCAKMHSCLARFRTFLYEPTEWPFVEEVD
jgi:hypothetical protein